MFLFRRSKTQKNNQNNRGNQNNKSNQNNKGNQNNRGNQNNKSNQKQNKRRNRTIKKIRNQLNNSNSLSQKCKCNENGVNILSMNILAPELLQNFWDMSYQLERPDTSELSQILEKKHNNVFRYIKKQNADIICLQEVSVPIPQDLDISDIQGARKYYKEQMIQQWKDLGLKISNFSFKHSGMKWDKPDDPDFYIEKKWSDKKYAMDSGVLTLYNPKIVEHLGSVNAEYFGKDEETYEFWIDTSNEIFKNKTSEEAKKFRKYLRTIPNCKFNSKDKCVHKSFNKGVGSPFILDKFRIINTGDIFYVCNTHIRMNYPKIDSIDTIVKRIRLSKKNVDKFRDFKWVKTVICGDFNAETVNGNTKIRSISKKLKMRNIFWKKSDDKILTGQHIITKTKKKDNILILKINVKNDQDILYNNQLIRGNNFTTDHPPMKVFFFVK